MQEGVEAIGKFVVTGSDTAKLVDAVEEALNQVACLVLLTVVLTRRQPLAARRGDCLSASREYALDKRIAVVPLVGNDCLGRNGFHQRCALCDVVNLHTRQDQPQWIAQGIHTGVDLGAQSTTRATNRLIARVFLKAPAECWCARTTVESMNNASRSASPRRASATRAHTPLISHRANRTYTECHCHNSTGRSRQGLPTRAVYNTASTNSRLLAARPPLSVGFPGHSSEIRAHCSSLNIHRFIRTIQIGRFKHKLPTVNTP